MAHEPRGAEIVLAAHELDQFGVGHQSLLQREGERPRERLGIIDCHLNLLRAEVDPAKTFGQPQAVTGRRAVLVDPRLVLEANGFYDQRVTVPPADGIAIPPRVIVPPPRVV